MEPISSEINKVSAFIKGYNLAYPKLIDKGNLKKRIPVAAPINLPRNKLEMNLHF
jgi:hypothetical protein